MKFAKPRFRNMYMIYGSLFVLTMWILTDPDLGLIYNLPIGGSTVAMLMILMKAVLYVALLHLSRKALMDYLNLDVLFKKAAETPDGAGKAIIGVSIIYVAIALVIFVATFK